MSFEYPLPNTQYPKPETHARKLISMFENLLVYLQPNSLHHVAIDVSGSGVYFSSAVMVMLLQRNMVFYGHRCYV